jgi:hypothetical protein
MHCLSPQVCLAVDVPLQERASVKGKSLQQLGDWQQPLTAAHEVRAHTASLALICACLCFLSPTTKLACTPQIIMSAWDRRTCYPKAACIMAAMHAKLLTVVLIGDTCVCLLRVHHLLCRLW